MGWLELIAGVAGAFSAPATPAIPGNQQISFGAYNVGGVQGDRTSADWMTFAAIGAMALVAVVVFKKMK